jgi:hypothetical protein
MKKITIISIAILLSGCMNTHRLDGGQSATFAEADDGTAGTETIIAPVSIFGGLLQFSLWKKRDNVISTIDEPTVASGSSIGSKTAAEALSASSTRTNGVKVVTYGAKGLSTEAQDIAKILERVEKFTPAGQVRELKKIE